MIIVSMEVESILIFLAIIVISCFFAWTWPKYRAFTRKRKKTRRHNILRGRLLRRDGATL
ncbi:MAG TPA: hypothetical protein DIC35_01600 [Candidatus Moranbacteria bacterium]|nr:hypothetical protein [Candidatus Moranbacteria bacterium]